MTSYEPVMAIVKFLRDTITDPDTSRDNLPIFPDWPRSDLSKNSFPRISVEYVSGVSTPAAIGATEKEDEKITIRIHIWVWAADNDKQILTINSDYYSEQKLLEYMVRQISISLKNNWYNNTYTKDYEKRNVNKIFVPFDPKTDAKIMHGIVEVEMERINA